MRHVFGRLIAFDLDGTLVDSSRDLADSINETLAEHGAAPLPHDAVTRMIGDGARVLVSRALVAAGVVETPQTIARFLEIYDARLLNHTRPYEGIVDAVHAARKQARVAIVTNKPLGPTQRLLEGLGLLGLFDDVVGGDGPFPRKPDPTALLGLMARAGAEPRRTLMIGDSRVDYEVAQRASARCCLVAYGFSYHSLAGVSTGDAWVAADVPGLVKVIGQFAADA